MSFEAGQSWSHDGLHFHGHSLSGIRTSVAMPELGLCFDVSQGYPFTLNLKKFFITHGHLDHAAGIPYIISQKSMTRQKPAEFYMPPSLVEPMDRMMKIWQEIEKHTYDYHFIPVSEGDTIELTATSFVRPFKTIHRVESFGYTLFERHKKLKAEFTGLSQNEIVELRRQKVEVQDFQEIPRVSFTGDTQIEFLDGADWIRKSKILFLETTYLDIRKSVAQARDWGHTHLDELIPRLKDLECEKIVLIHISSRYPAHEIAKIIQERIPAEFQDRIVIFPGR